MTRKTNPNTTFDATYSERLRLLQSDREQYFRENPRPKFGFCSSNDEGQQDPAQ